MMHGLLITSNFLFSACLTKVVSVIVGAYDLVVIEDEATPLAANAVHTNYYLITVGVMLALVLVAAVALWAVKRKRYSDRLKELNGKLASNDKVPFTIGSIKEKIAQAETEITAAMI